VASNLGESAGKQTPAFEGALQYGSTMSGWGELGRRMWRSSTPRPPALIQILFHAMSIPSFQSQEGLAALAARDNVCILQPPVGAFGLFEVTAAVGRSLEKVAWEYSKVALAEVAAAWSQRQLRNVL
jgi:hypothetical protein